MKFFNLKTVVCLPVIVLISCNKENNEKSVLDANVEIVLESKSGTDLLNPNNKDSYKEKEIELYYVIDGKPIKQFNGNLNDPKMFRIGQSTTTGQYVLTVYSNITPSSTSPLKDGEQTLTYLQLSPTDTDTIKTEFRVANEGNLKAITKIWYNDVPMWEAETQIGRRLIIKK